VVSYVFSDTLLVKDLATAREVMGGVRLVTLDGDLIDPSNAMTGGALPNREISRDIEALASKLSSLKSRRTEVKNEISRLDSEMRNYAEQLSKINLQAGRNQGELSQILSRKSEMEAQLKSRRAYLEERKKALEISENELKKMKDMIALEESELKSVSSEMEKIEQERDRSLDKKTRDEIANLREKLSEIRKSLDDDSKSLAELRTNSGILKSNVESILEMSEKKEQELSEAKGELQTTREAAEKARVELETISAIFRSKEQKLKEIGAEIEKLSNERYKVTSEIESKGAVKKAKSDFLISLNTKMEDAFSRIREIDREIQEKNVELVDDQRTKEEIKKEISSLEAQLKQMEPVNLKSISDYQEEKTRLDELVSKKTKLEAEMKRLEELESRLEEQKKVIFLQVFEAVNKNFIQIYKELTNGNEGYLELENVTNPFQGGLIIKASSRGKRVDNIASLSGGEKSIAALSFIIAIQNYEPSPIYFMDEVDMFLDGVNAENVGSLFRRNSENAQIIAVTLRKATMKYAHHIIGVTFQDRNSTVFVKDLEVEEVTP